MTCGDGWIEIPMAFIEKSKVVVAVQRCEAGSCKTKRVSFGVPSGVLAVDSVELARGNVYVVYRAKSGETRARLGPLDDLEKTKPEVVFDSDQFGGVSTRNPYLIASEGVAYYLPSDEDSRVVSLSPGQRPQAVQ
jgi:hypothetical protein